MKARTQLRAGPPARSGAAAYARRMDTSLDAGHDRRGPAAQRAAAFPKPNSRRGCATPSWAFLREVDSLRQRTDPDPHPAGRSGKDRRPGPVLPLLNRRAFVRELTRYIAFTARYNTPASLIYFDLNHLKRSTTRWAMPRAMRCLRISPRSCCRHVRDSDCVGRLGGDEFGILLSHAEPGSGA